MDERCKSSKVDRNLVGLNVEDARLLTSIVLGWILDKQFGKAVKLRLSEIPRLVGLGGAMETCDTPMRQRRLDVE